MPIENTTVAESPPSPKTVHAVEAWLSFVLALLCSLFYSARPLHPKGDPEAIKQIIGLCILCAVGTGMAFVGLRFCKGLPRIASWVAFVLNAAILIDLAFML